MTLVYFSEYLPFIMLFVVAIGFILYTNPNPIKAIKNKNLREYRIISEVDNLDQYRETMYKVQQNTTKLGWKTVYSSRDKSTMELAYKILLNKIPRTTVEVIEQYPKFEQEKW